MRLWRSNGHKNLKRAVERFVIPEPTKLRPPSVCVAEQICATPPFNHQSCRRIQKREFQPIFIMALIPQEPPPPFFKLFFFSLLLRQTVQSLDVEALCKATLCALSLLEGGRRCRCRCRCRWKLIVGGILSAPKIPIEKKKLRSDQLASASQNLFRPRSRMRKFMHTGLLLGRIYSGPVVS